MRYILIAIVNLIGFCCLSSCNNKDISANSNSEEMQYSEGMKISRQDDYIAIDILNPWKEGAILQRYILVPKGDELPNNLPNGTIIRTPIDNIVIYSSIHATILKELKSLDRIIGVCETQYVAEPKLKERIKNGEIADLGQASNPNTEKIMDIGAEIIIASPFENSSYGAVAQIGVPIIEAADYMEQTPLARAEWIKLYGLLLEQENIADSIFLQTESNYRHLISLCDSLPENKKPTLLTEKKYGSTWDTSPGGSYMATMYKDAGANYIFDYLEGTKSIPMSFETVLDKAINADIWIMKYFSSYGDMTYESLKTEYTPYSHFEAFKNKNIYGCNTANPDTNYYDDIALHPDYILKDLIKLFHPGLLPEYQLRYFQALK